MYNKCACLLNLWRHSSPKYNRYQGYGLGSGKQFSAGRSCKYGVELRWVRQVSPVDIMRKYSSMVSYMLHNTSGPLSNYTDMRFWSHELLPLFNTWSCPRSSIFILSTNEANSACSWNTTVPPIRSPCTNPNSHAHTFIRIYIYLYNTCPTDNRSRRFRRASMWILTTNVTFTSHVHSK